MYGLPKIHKLGFPLRPIVASNQSPTYNLANFFTWILSSVRNDNINIQSADLLLDLLGDIVLDESDTFVSIDVVAVFSNIPVDPALTILGNRWDEIKKFVYQLQKNYFLNP